MNILRLSKRHLLALLTIMGALTMVIYSTARASESDLNHHNNAPEALYVAPLNSPVNINIQGFAFSPNNIQITTGTMVTWTNLDAATHTSSSLTAVWDSGSLTQNQTFSFTFNSAGTFPYRCNIHTGMTASITVVDPTNTPTATSTSTATPTNTAVPPRPDTIGVYKDGVFYLRNSNNAGPADITVSFGGDPSDLPVAGDWNNDGVDTIGIYRSSTGVFFLSNSNVSPTVIYNPVFGNPGDRPFSGKWTADMTGDGIGVYRNSNGILYQRKSLTTGFDDFFAIYGNPGDRSAAGDWDGNGFDSIGIFRGSDITWYLSNNSTPSGITFSDIAFLDTVPGNAEVLGGDWDGDGISTTGYTVIGIVSERPANQNSTTNIQFAFGPIDTYPVSGKWIPGSRPPPVASVNVGQPDSHIDISAGGAD